MLCLEASHTFEAPSGKSPKRRLYTFLDTRFFCYQMFDAFEQILPSGAPRMPLWTAWSHVGDLLCTGFGKVLVIDAEDRMAGCLMHIL